MLSIEQNTMDNVMNSLQAADTWSPAPSPDELVIQKRGRRRRTIVWSPDLDACKRDSLLRLVDGYFVASQQINERTNE